MFVCFWLTEIPVQAEDYSHDELVGKFIFIFGGEKTQAIKL